MASHHDVVQRVLWLKTKLSSDPLPEISKIIKLLHKLSKLPVDVEVLQETGIGKCVNGLKKKCPEIAMYVKPLIQSWKALVQRAMLAEAEQKQSESGLENGEKDEEEAVSPSSQSSSPLPDAEVSSPPSGTSSPDLNEDQNHFLDQSDEEREQHHNVYGSCAHKRERQETSQYQQQKLKKEHVFNSIESPPKKQKVSHNFKPSNEDMKKGEKGDDRGSSDRHRTEYKESQNRPKKKMNSSGSSSILESSPKHHRDSHKSKAESTRSKSVLSDQNSSHSQVSKHKPSENIASNFLRNEKKLFSKSGKITTDSGRVVSEGSTVSKPKKSLPKSANMDDSDMLFQPDVAKSENKLSPSSKKKSEHQMDKINKRTNVSRIDKTSKSTVERETDVHRVNTEKKSIKSEPSKKILVDRKIEKGTVHSEKRQSSSKDKRDSDARNSKSDARNSKSDAGTRESPGHSKKSICEKAKPFKSASVKPSSDEEPAERTFENTGMSFEDCLFGGSVPVLKKSKPPQNNSAKSNSASHDRTANDDRKVLKSNDNKSKSKKPVKDQSDSKRKKERDGKTTNKRQIKEEMDAKGSVKKIKESQQRSEEIREASASEVDLTLPDIQPDYKPLRLPEIKPSERRKAPVDSELSSKWFGSKQTKTKVYSGKARKRHWDHVPSLQDICKEVIFDNIDALYETGGVPFHVMEDILEKCTAQQLLKIEDYNPDYMLDSDHLWQKHCEKTFNGCEPDDMESWKDLYVRKSDEREHKLLAITANISASMAKKETGRLTKLAFVDRPVKPPRNVIRQQIRHGTSVSSSPAKAPRPKKPVPGESSSSHRVVPVKEPAAPVQRQRTAKVVAPMMQKSLKLMKRVSSRR